MRKSIQCSPTSACIRYVNSAPVYGLSLTMDLVSDRGRAHRYALYPIPWDLRLLPLVCTVCNADSKLSPAADIFAFAMTAHAGGLHSKNESNPNISLVQMRKRLLLRPADFHNLHLFLSLGLPVIVVLALFIRGHASVSLTGPETG